MLSSLRQAAGSVLPISQVALDLDTGRWGLLLASAGLLAVCAIAILFLPPAYAAAPALGTLAAFVAIRHPTASLITFLFARMTIDLMWWLDAGLGLNFMELSTGGITVLLLAMCLHEFRRVVRHPYFPAVVTWVGLLVLGAIQQPELRVVAELMARFVSPFLVLLLVSIHFTDHRDRKKLFVAFLAGGAIPIVGGLAAAATGQASDLQIDGYQRLRGLYSNIADHGLGMATFAMIGTVWLSHYRSGWRAVALVGYVVGACILLVLTYTRTPLVGLAMFIAVFFFLQGNRRIFAALVVSLVLVLATNSIMQDRFSDFWDLFMVDAGRQMDRLGSGRIGIWRRSLVAFTDQPFLQIIVGNGLNGQYLLAGNDHDSHNDYLSTLLQVGPLGLFIWLGCQIDVTRRSLAQLALEVRPWTRTVLVAVVSLSACVFVCDVLSNAYLSRVTMSWFWWGMAGLVFAIEDERRGQADRLLDTTAKSVHAR